MRLFKSRENGSAKMTSNPPLRTWKGSLECRADKFSTTRGESLFRCRGSIRVPAPGLGSYRVTGSAGTSSCESAQSERGVEFGSWLGLEVETHPRVREKCEILRRDTKINGKRAGGPLSLHFPCSYSSLLALRACLSAVYALFLLSLSLTGRSSFVRELPLKWIFAATDAERDVDADKAKYARRWREPSQ